MTEPLLTREEKDHISSLVRSPGWALLLKHLFIPELQRASHQLDQPGLDITQTQLWRGMKLELNHVLKFCYAQTTVLDPFVEYGHAFLTSLNLTSQVGGPDQPCLEEESEMDPRARRPAYPVF